MIINVWLEILVAILASAFSFFSKNIVMFFQKNNTKELIHNEYVVSVKNAIEKQGQKDNSTHYFKKPKNKNQTELSIFKSHLDILKVQLESMKKNKVIAGFELTPAPEKFEIRVTTVKTQPVNPLSK